MNRIIGRSKIMIALILVIALGISFFLGEYALRGGTWVLKSGSPHIYDTGSIGCGMIADRDGVLLLNMKDGRTYAPSLPLRHSVIHWVGDRQGNISAPIMKAYAKELAGFDPINGVYSYGGIGGTAKLTLSAKVQIAAQEAMSDAKGTLAIYNYRTGEIICAVSTPNFDPDDVPDISGDTTGAYEGAYVNRFVQSTYTPGSIFKIVTAAAALETVPDIMEQKFVCTGLVQYGVDKVTCQRVHGKQSFADAFANSCNCAFASIANQVGGAKLEEFAKKFGLLDGVRFDGIVTAAGSMDCDDAAEVLVAWSGIGQHVDLINSCSYLAFVGAIANDGVLMQPYLVKGITTGGKITYRAENREVGRILSEDSAKVLQSMLKNNVEVKYGQEKFPDLVLGAKTGTAQVGKNSKPNATFAGFVESESLPLAFLAIIEDGETGGKTCIPRITQTLQACIDHLQ